MRVCVLNFVRNRLTISNLRRTDVGFNFEFTPQTVAGWSSLPGYVSSLEKHLGEGAYPRLLRQSYPLMPEMARMTRRIYDNLVSATGLRR